ncbi:protein of unknown function [Serratia sp. Tan611]|nr:protein of unknown function [Serratia sp. Tan611]
MTRRSINPRRCRLKMRCRCRARSAVLNYQFTLLITIVRLVRAMGQRGARIFAVKGASELSSLRTYGGENTAA